MFRSKMRMSTCRIILITSLAWLLIDVILIMKYTDGLSGGIFKKSHENEVIELEIFKTESFLKVKAVNFWWKKCKLNHWCAFETTKLRAKTTNVNCFYEKQAAKNPKPMTQSLAMFTVACSIKEHLNSPTSALLIYQLVY